MLLKPALALSHEQCHAFIIYIDTLPQVDSYDLCANVARDTLSLLDDLGFTVHPVKLVFKPSQSIEFSNGGLSYFG